MLDHQLHDAGRDGEVDELLGGELMHQAVDQGSGKGISRADSLQAVHGVNGAFVEMSVF